MKRNVHKKFFAGLLSSLMLLSTLFVSTYAFDGPTHQYTTQEGLRIIKDCTDSECNRFYNSSARKQIINYCTMPDKDETTGAFKWHFYNPATEANFAGESTSALTKFMEHYRQALESYKDGNFKKSFEQLGRSLHFLEDLNTPVHTNNEIVTDAVVNVSYHIKFEKKCVEVQSNYKSDNLSPKQFNYYTNNSLINIGKNCSYTASDNFCLLENNVVKMDEIAGNVIINAQRSVAGILYRFYQDTINL